MDPFWSQIHLKATATVSSLNLDILNPVAMAMHVVDRIKTGYILPIVREKSIFSLINIFIMKSEKVS